MNITYKLVYVKNDTIFLGKLNAGFLLQRNTTPTLEKKTILQTETINRSIIDLSDYSLPSRKYNVKKELPYIIIIHHSFSSIQGTFLKYF